MHVLYPGGMKFGDFFFGGQNRESGEKPSEKQEATTLIQIILDKVL